MVSHLCFRRGTTPHTQMQQQKPLPAVSPGPASLAVKLHCWKNTPPGARTINPFVKALVRGFKPQMPHQDRQEGFTWRTSHNTRVFYANQTPEPV